MKKTFYLAATLLAIMMYATTLTNAQSWLLTGNGPLAPTDFLGTTMNESLIFKTYGVERMRILPTGFIGIGTSAPASPLDLFNNNNTQFKSFNIKHSLDVGNTNVGCYNTTSNTGDGLTYAFYADLPSNSSGGGVQGAYFGKVSGTGNGQHYGTYIQLTGAGAGHQYGAYSTISNTGKGEHTGYFTSLTGSGIGKQYGLRISISNSGSGTHYGVYSVLSGSNSVTKYGVYSSATGGSNNYAFYGIGRSYFSDNVGIGLTQPSAKLHVSNSVEVKTASFRNDYSGNGTKSGIFNEVTNLGTGGRYGIYNAVSSPSTSTAAAYGIYSKLEAGSGIAWGILSEGSNTSNADAYGIYATASSTGSANSRYGVRGYANSNNGAGVKSYGVYGSANGGGAISENYGVYGTASGGSTANYAGYFNGLTYTDELRVGATQNVTGYIVSVDGKIICEELRVQERGDWPDYVFEDSYQLPSLEEVEQHIKAKKHLPGIPSACEVEENGLLVGEMQKKMMEKIEELTLYLIELKKENNQIRAEMELLKGSK